MEKEILFNELRYPEKYQKYDMGKEAVKPSKLFSHFLIPLIVKLSLIGQKNTQDIDPRFNEIKKEQYLLLENHMQFLDFYIEYKVIGKKKINNIVNLDAYQVLPYWLMELGGCIPKRKFTQETLSIRSMKKVVDKGGSVGVFPEARYTPIGRTSPLPDSIGKFIKYLKIPVVTIINHGNHLVKPTWGNQKNRKLPIKAVVKVCLTKEEVLSLSVAEINERVREHFKYDEYQYQLDNNILIKEDFRTIGIEKILYKCPHCHDEKSMIGTGTTVKCQKCGAEYQLNENGSLTNLKGETVFSKVLDWCDWEKDEVSKEIQNGTYRFEEDMETWAFPHPKYLIKIPNAHVVHDINGFEVRGNYNGYDYLWKKEPLDNFSVQLEYSWPNKKYEDGSRANIFALHTSNDGLYFLPKDPRILFKIYLAVELLFNMAEAKIKQQ
ncbi:MAG: hypothetical protein LBM99_04510 [Bacillales bacterium]|jgi:transcription elongation factor Elf1|nr:hypothetical protein [Bacillales bacterium]